MSKQSTTLIACSECDLLQREISLLPGGAAVCCCCGSTLYRNMPESLQRTLAFTAAAVIFFVMANVYPILGIEIQGLRNATNLSGAVQSLWNQEMHLISVLVALTTIMIPAVELATMLYLLLPLSLRLKPPGIAPIMRVLHVIKPWGMVEVFMVGVLVSLVKLKNDSIIIPGIALWSFGGLTLLMAAMAASFNPRAIWELLDEVSDGKEGVCGG